ncbi:hypothetical protein Y900_015690 [Mycolicibacterium aromaticivorans JS19b1 = JCM 16368]|uniref:Uncharacterized protein n=1 Tax=Mycolicibacterium aromaticivorans JS19b1 = JCM 16368 TaxID=1440774 RepID=A0A064CIG3_9MYCO|nr:hypothetical protein [Mycolicibacterium aromaticivorans]KDF00345.1 hypothetical protein Y900_015690 [Mycolicibacterium aromaticivorans JS19b1 = JCM 16368]
MKNDEELIEASEWPWDDVVDVICAGAGPGALAHAICCADHDLDVEIADAEISWQTMDSDIAAYLESMTEDLGLEGTPVRDLELTAVRAQPVPVKADRRATIEPFFGSRLRDWSVRCIASPFGVIYSQVPDIMTPMRSESETVRVAVLGDQRSDADRPGLALAQWLRQQADARDIYGARGTVLQRLIFEHGRIAGAELATPERTRLVRATEGVALSIGPLPAEADWPVQTGLPGGAQVALVSRTASRFGRVELLYSL